MKSFQPIVNCIILMMALVLNAACSASDEEDVMTSNQTTLAKATPAITRASSANVDDSASLTISFQAYGNNGEAISQIDPNTTVSVKDVKISAIMNTTDGQTHTTTLTTGNDNTVYLHVVPGTGSVQITATYAVRTIDKNLAKGYCETQSTVTETLSDKTFLAGRSYSFAIGLNLSSLQFSANTNGWG